MSNTSTLALHLRRRSTVSTWPLLEAVLRGRHIAGVSGWTRRLARPIGNASLDVAKFAERFQLASPSADRAAELDTERKELTDGNGRISADLMEKLADDNGWISAYRIYLEAVA